ncbi:MAG: hypothetical protein DWB56_07085 [Candidatus Jettenia sp.]|uniref:Uncharacterized protein n=1 Tax=Candidatus Jettenia caeni TaxID=247490 RepID=I3IMT3_9BACT|nr:MAG: hypothetical protein EDM77_04025 [Candidatus Jettenia sp. AMX1]MBC6928715.1 hypothetical protein [Candidatus Jettenia sp.]MCE7880027.1 hypothetical protein [Candidatus Jettenia sp. AMX1]MCQ3926809.1 hypothetical protein [Candidatus Jettenia sp.]GAB63028.1 hypothetical protein KSU1_C1432 [Candidatus Jettenia caeni]
MAKIIPIIPELDYKHLISSFLYSFNHRILKKIKKTLTINFHFRNLLEADYLSLKFIQNLRQISLSL